jgi:hypothetical protein
VFASRGRRLTLRACGWLCATDDTTGSSSSSDSSNTAAAASATAAAASSGGGAGTSEQQLSSERGSDARKFTKCYYLLLTLAGLCNRLFTLLLLSWLVIEQGLTESSAISSVIITATAVAVLICALLLLVLL